MNEPVNFLKPRFTVTSYNVNVTPNMSGDFKFKAEVEIFATTKDSLSQISLHAVDLNILTGFCQVLSEKKVKRNNATKFEYNEGQRTVTIFFERAIPVASVMFRFEYTGEHKDNMTGFYRSTFKAGTETKVLLATQCAPMSARRIFPCVDEPAHKAIFNCSLTVDENLTALGNTSKLDEVHVIIDKKRKVEVKFAPTPVMSTYLVAFVVGEVNPTSNGIASKDGVVVNVYSTNGKQILGVFGNFMGPRLLDAFSDLFVFNYPLSKLDLVALPDFASGAMENYGLVTFREKLLLADLTAFGQQMTVIQYISHELSHMWFGNLITCAWWNDIWLNEGFARFLEHYGMELVTPGMKVWDMFVCFTLFTGMSKDSYLCSHPIEFPIKTHGDVEEAFDSITYDKGSSVVRMIYAYLGNDTFWLCLRAFLNRYQYDNVQTADLWQVLEFITKKPVGRIFSTWTEQSGHPMLSVLNVTKAPVANNLEKESVTIEVEQSWFLAAGHETEDTKFSRHWGIPLFVSVGGSTPETPVENLFLGVMEERTGKFTFDKKKDDWFKLNGDQKVPMRVLYGDDLLVKFKTELPKGGIPASDRQGLINDALYLASAGELDPALLLDLLWSYKSESDYYVMNQLYSAFQELHNYLSEDAELCERFKLFLDQFWTFQPGKMSFAPIPETENYVIPMMKTFYAVLLCEFEHVSPELLADAKARFEQYFQTADEDSRKTILPDEFKLFVFRIVLKNSEESEVLANFTLVQNEISKMGDEKYISEFQTLGYVNSEALKAQVLDFGLREVRPQDFDYVAMGVANSGPKGVTALWNYLKVNYQTLDAKFGATPKMLERMVQSCVSKLTTIEEISEVEEFFKKNTLSVSKAIEEARESAMANLIIGKRLRSSKSLADYLRAEGWKN